MVLDDSGRLVHNAWYEFPERFPRLQLDAFTIMPKHVHGILIFSVKIDGPVKGLKMTCLHIATC
ncbi:MAG: hypothetical protein JEZ02_17695 [Desulfatibacillum sp.]|nr:hypothetical protein [Desulfatibacillum sp.]